MKKNESIKNVMSSELISATTNQKISEVKALMQKNHVNHVPICAGKKLLGLISRTDLLRSSYSDLFVSSDKAADEQLDSVAKVEDIMTRDIKTIKDTDTVRDAALLILAANYNSLPVIDSNEDLIGVVTSKDIVRYLIEQY